MSLLRPLLRLPVRVLPLRPLLGRPLPLLGSPGFPPPRLLSTSPPPEVGPPALPPPSATSAALASPLASFLASTSSYSASGAPPVPLFEALPLEPYGPGTGREPLSTFGQVSSRESLVSISLYDPALARAVADAVATSRELERVVGSLNPAVDEGRGLVSVRIPKVTRERREALARLVKERGDKAAQGMRGARKAAMDQCKRVLKDEESGVGKDEVKRREKEIEKACKEAAKELDDEVKSKMKEVLG
ncbi:hypothetical protein TeGR_g6096 [Tetraparma gracilis]|uniref:Ribosome recycling factor domain-containing protein n=1 Tax=Tetraparma gracilis TaxID=2962635 RepID=A0ABQ6MIM7_9STRA|nr:hypothetical protein TeGR_g6096 [Tetraparma gracilis]